MSQQSFLQQAGTGSDINFTIDTFSADEIEVYVDGILKTATTHYNINPYNSNSQSTIAWTSGNAPTSSNTVRIVRKTNILNQGNTSVEGRATYAAGSSVKADDLNNNQKQVLRAIQERQDQKIQRYDLEDNEVVRSKIAADAIDGTKIADDSIDSEHIAADSIDTEHYAANSVDATAIGSNAVTTVKILNDNVTMDKLGSGALPTDITVNTDNLVNGTIQTVDIGADQITNALIADNQIDSEHYVDGSIDTQHIGNQQVTGAKIENNTITDSQIAVGTLDNRYYTESELNAGQLDTRYYTETELDGGAIDSRYYTETELNNGALDGRYYTEAELNPSASLSNNVLDARYFTETELTNGALDGRYFTETEAEAAFLRQDSSETIASGVTWSSTDDKVATTAAIDLRVIELVDDVGGFVPIANETSFPTTNPDINTSGSAKGGTIVSVIAASTDLTAQSGTTLTIADGRGTGNAVIITGVSATIPSGFGFLVETTATDHTYAFHRLVPKATEVSTVAANAVNIASAGANITSIDNFADRYQISNNAPTARPDSGSLQNGDLWFDSSSNKVMMVYDGSSGDGFSPITPNQSDLTNINIVAGQITFTEDLGLITNAVNTGSGNNSVNTVATDITNVNTVAGSISNVNAVAGNATNINAVAADATDIGAVAGKATEIGRLGTADAVADLAILGTNAIVSDMDTLADISSNITTVAGIASNVTTVAGNNSNVSTVAGVSSNVTSVANSIANVNTTAGSIANVNTTAGSISNVNTVGAAIANVNTTASNIANVNNFAATYQIASSDPSTDGAGNALAAGDLYFNTSSNELRVHNGSAFQGGVTATGNLAGLGANTFTGTQTLQAGLAVTGNITVSGTVDGVDVAAFKTSFDNLNTDLVNDTTPQLGGALDGQNNNLSNIGTIDGSNLQLDFGTI
tara:strand:+ start:2547 stop:5327 length:2781 start_codon:yes stop_codon:yes gene_type:complete